MENIVSAQDLLVLLPEEMLIFFSLFFFLFGKKIPALRQTASVVTLLSAVAVVVLRDIGFDMLSSVLVADDFSFVMRLFFLFILFLVLSGSVRTTSGDFSGEYAGFNMAATSALMLLCSADDMVLLFVAFELVSISTYVLPFFAHSRKEGEEAGMKYFFNSALSTGLVAYGFSLLYGFTGTTSLRGMAEVHTLSSGPPNEILLYASFAFLLAGLGYKLAAFPFYFWAPDTYCGSPSEASAFLSAATKKGAFVVLARLLVPMFSLMHDFSVSILILVACLTMTMGNLAALKQANVKRMIAFSSVSHAGNILAGFAVATSLGFAGGFLHLIAHGIMAAGIFLIIMSAAENDEFADYPYESFRGFGRRYPAGAAIITLLLLSLAGVPPFIGFWSKMFIVIAAVDAGGVYYTLAAFVIVNSVLSLAYYGKLLKEIYTPSEGEGEPVSPAGRFSAGAFVSAVAVTLLGLFPYQIFEMARNAAATFFV